MAMRWSLLLMVIVVLSITSSSLPERVNAETSPPPSQQLCSASAKLRTALSQLRRKRDNQMEHTRSAEFENSATSSSSSSSFICSIVDAALATFGSLVIDLAKLVRFDPASFIITGVSASAVMFALGWLISVWTHDDGYFSSTAENLRQHRNCDSPIAASPELQQRAKDFYIKHNFLRRSLRLLSDGAIVITVVTFFWVLVCRSYFDEYLRDRHEEFVENNINIHGNLNAKFVSHSTRAAFGSTIHLVHHLVVGLLIAPALTMMVFIIRLMLAEQKKNVDGDDANAVAMVNSAESAFLDSRRGWR